jgi:hypothetical protein
MRIIDHSPRDRNVIGHLSALCFQETWNRGDRARVQKQWAAPCLVYRNNEAPLLEASRNRDVRRAAGKAMMFPLFARPRKGNPDALRRLNNRARLGFAVRASRI